MTRPSARAKYFILHYKINNPEVVVHAQNYRLSGGKFDKSESSYSLKVPTNFLD